MIVLVLLLGRSSSSSASPTKPELSAEKKLLVIPAENALLETIEAGDIVQFYTANGSIGSIRHVLVYSVGADGFTVAMTEQQLCDYLNAVENGYVTVLPLIMGDWRAAEAALEQQRAWNASKIALSVFPSQSDVEAGGTVQLKTQLTVTPEGAILHDIVWSSSDEAIAYVDADGVVHAMQPGKVLITASCGEEMASCTLSVMIYNTELHFDAESHDIEIGESLLLTLQATCDQPLGFSDCPNKSNTTLDKNIPLCYNPVRAIRKIPAIVGPIAGMKKVHLYIEKRPNSTK